MELLIYMTTPSRDEALGIARMLVTKKLAAGVNMVPGARSIYSWDGEIREASECVLFAQIPAATFEKVLTAVKELHSHIVPCVIGLPVEGGNPDFLAWVNDTCAGAAK